MNKDEFRQFLKHSVIYLVLCSVIYLVTFEIAAYLAPGAVFLTLIAVGIVFGSAGQTLFDRSVKAPYWKVLLLIAANLAVMVPILLLLGFETAICIVIGIPIFLPALLVGMAIKRSWLVARAADNDTKMYSIAVILPVAVLLIEGQVAYPLYQGTEISEIEIDAPPSVVWRNTVEISEIQPRERIWTFSHDILGAPQPVSATLDDGVRDLRWTKGVRFQEIITTTVNQERLEWRFLFHDKDSLVGFDPHISPDSYYLSVADGFYELEALERGRTLLRLETHYKMHTPFNPYLKWWGTVFLQDFHRSVLAVVKSRSEEAV